MMYRSAWLVVLAVMSPQLAVAQDTVRDSVVKIHSQQRLPDFVRPWVKGTTREVSGSGAIIDGKRILTNAHVVLYASRILVQANQSTERIPATVEAIAPGIDLAVLKLSNEAIFDTRPPLSLDDSLPKIKNTVNAYGFPVGGEQLSVTEGIISRVEYVSYADTEIGMRIQVDAALNPGNSGGPAVVNGKIVGLVFSVIANADNIGYLIPVDEIRMFLHDIEDGKYEGKPKLLDNMQTVENKALREKLGLDPATGGLMITRPLASDESYPFKEWDVITHIGDQPIDNQGNIPVGEELRLSFRYLIPKLVKDGQDRSDNLAQRPVHQGASTREVHQRSADPAPVGQLSVVLHLWTAGLHHGVPGTGYRAARPRAGHVGTASEPAPQPLVRPQDISRTSNWCCSVLSRSPARLSKATTTRSSESLPTSMTWRSRIWHTSSSRSARPKASSSRSRWAAPMNRWCSIARNCWTRPRRPSKTSRFASRCPTIC